MNSSPISARVLALGVSAFLITTSALTASADVSLVTGQRKCCVKVIPKHMRTVYRTEQTPCDNHVRKEPIYKTIKTPVYKTKRVPKYETKIIPIFEERYVPDWKTVTRPKTKRVIKPLMAKRTEAHYIDEQVPQTKIVNVPQYRWVDRPVYEEKLVPKKKTIQVPVTRTRRVRIYKTVQIPQYENQKTPHYDYRDEPIYDYIRVPVCKTCKEPVLGTQEIREKYFGGCGTCEECVDRKTVKICECEKKMPAGWVNKKVCVGTKRVPFIAGYTGRELQVGAKSRKVPCGWKTQKFIHMETKEVDDGWETKRVLVGNKKERIFVGYAPVRKHAGYRTEKKLFTHTVTHRPAGETVVSECEDCETKQVYNGTKTIKVRAGERAKKIQCGWEMKRYLAGYKETKKIVGYRTIKTPICPGTKRVADIVCVPARKVTVVANGAAYASPLPGTTEVMTLAQYESAYATAMARGGAGNAIRKAISK